MLGIEGFAVVDLRVGIGRTLLRAEDAMQPRHSERSSTDNHQHQERNPQPPENPENRRTLPLDPAPGDMLSARTCLHVGHRAIDSGDLERSKASASAT